MRTAAILPVKRFAQAKQRLGASVADPLRLDLARAMVGDVLTALAETASIERTIVVTSEPSWPTTARATGERSSSTTPPRRSERRRRYSAFERALAEGMERVLCVPATAPRSIPASSMRC